MQGTPLLDYASFEKPERTFLLLCERFEKKRSFKQITDFKHFVLNISDFKKFTAFKTKITNKF